MKEFEAVRKLDYFESSTGHILIKRIHVLEAGLLDVRKKVPEEAAPTAEIVHDLDVKDDRYVGPPVSHEPLASRQKRSGMTAPDRSAG